MAETTTPTFVVGDRVTSIYGHEHAGKVQKVCRFSDGGEFYLVERDSDGFVWVGLPFTILKS